MLRRLCTGRLKMLEFHKFSARLLCMVYQGLSGHAKTSELCKVHLGPRFSKGVVQGLSQSTEVLHVESSKARFLVGARSS